MAVSRIIGKLAEFNRDESGCVIGLRPAVLLAAAGLIAALLSACGTSEPLTPEQRAWQAQVLMNYANTLAAQPRLPPLPNFPAEVYAAGQANRPRMMYCGPPTVAGLYCQGN